MLDRLIIGLLVCLPPIVACQDTQFDAWLGVDVGIGNQADVAMSGDIKGISQQFHKHQHKLT